MNPRYLFILVFVLGTGASLAQQGSPGSAPDTKPAGLSANTHLETYLQSNSTTQLNQHVKVGPNLQVSVNRNSGQGHFHAGLEFYRRLEPRRVRLPQCRHSRASNVFDLGQRRKAPVNRSVFVSSTCLDTPWSGHLFAFASDQHNQVHNAQTFFC